MREFFSTAFQQIPAVKEAYRKIAEGSSVQFSGVPEGARAEIIARMPEKVKLVITASEKEAAGLTKDLSFFMDNVFYFPAKDFLFYEADVRSHAIVKERLRVIQAIFSRTEDKELTVVTTFSALMNRMMPPTALKESVFTIRVGEETDLSNFIEKLVEYGYERTPKTENPGEFSSHGGIIDVFPLTEEKPVRIEFFDTEVETIRYFNPTSQVSVEEIKEISLYPAGDILYSWEEYENGEKAIREDYEQLVREFKTNEDYSALSSWQEHKRVVLDRIYAKEAGGLLERLLPYFVEETAYFEDYFPSKTVFIFSDPIRLRDAGLFTETEFLSSYEMRLKKGLIFPKVVEFLRTVKECFLKFSIGKTVVLSALDTQSAELKTDSVFSLDCHSTLSYVDRYKEFLKDLKDYENKKYQVIFLVESKARAVRIADELTEYGIHSHQVEWRDNLEWYPGLTYVMQGSLQKGYVYPKEHFVCITENDVFKTVEKRKKIHHTLENAERIRSLNDLTIGDFVVHEDHGIGIYRGIKNIEVDHVKKDYIEISYGKSGTLYVGVTNIDVVQKYISADGQMPRLSRLDSPDWTKTKSNVRKAVEEVAAELVDLYYEREHSEGFDFSPDSAWQREFEESFPYEETQDQLRAIEDVKKDMESTKIMDRLICGDVGFGKTEIALRAAFKAVQDSKQVVFLVPTTLLCRQHYRTFADRMNPYPVRIAMLSRFTSAAEEKKVREGLKTGQIDVVIGTHKLLSDKIEYKNLGLLVIDEEQRFGVKHKEKIKSLKNNVDVITLTATPIPRTLHMSMIGIRDMSLLREPPENREAIQTYVMEYSDTLAVEAIKREVARHGQVYFVQNKTENLDALTAHLKALLPDVSFTYIHGKMSETQIEQRMLDFIDGSIDCLVCTSIIETGLDIPNVNTIIIADAELYGLSQLYQLRGRVGRSNRQAFAFIMYSKNKIPTEQATKRLEAIRQFTELGSGIRIAMQDLEIRGAGTLLGNLQSGHMTLVGYDLYCKLLSEAVKRKMGKEEALPSETSVELSIDGHIPDFYIPDENTKLEIYKEISRIQSAEEAELLRENLKDRFGEIPRPVENLIRIALLRERARRLYFKEIKGNSMNLRLSFVIDAKINPEKIPELVSFFRGAMRFEQGNPPSLIYTERDMTKSGQSPLDLLDSLLEKINELLIEQKSDIILG